MKKLLFLIISAIFILFPFQSQAQEIKEERFEAKILEIKETGNIIELDGRSHIYQRLRVIGTKGSLKNKVFEIENGGTNQIGLTLYKVGDELVLTKIQDARGKDIISITDIVRRNSLLILAGIFIILTIIIGGKRGAFSILGMVITFILIFFYALPSLSHGANPYLTSLLLALIVIPVTFILSHGLSKKTFCAIGGTFIALIISGFLAYYFTQSAHLSGFASEEAGFLDVIKKGTLDIKGLLFAGIVIALLGILEDITISQSAIVMQLKKANSKLTFMELFKRAMDIGRDHIASMANTLILVYAGASLPLLLLFIDNPLPFTSILNTEMIAEEIVRTLTASIGLIIAVPITTLITAAVVTYNSDKS